MAQAKKSSPTSLAKKNRPLLRDEIMEIDKSILHLMLKRFNLSEKLRKQQKTSEDEKAIRESWLANAAKISQDPQIGGAFYNMLQNLSFRPQPGKKKADGTPYPGSEKRDAFNLAPPHLPVLLSMQAPLSAILTEIWIYIACASGKSLGIDPVLPNDSLADLIYNLRQMGSQINFEVDNIGVTEGKPLGAPDIVLSVGGSELNLFLLMAHYLCRPSRVRINGQGALASIDLKPLASFLPELGARLTNIIPKSTGLPVRLECTGLLPERIVFASGLPRNFPLLMGVAALFYEKPITLDYDPLADKKLIISRLEYLYKALSVQYQTDGFCIQLSPENLVIPSKPSLPMDACVSSFLLALAEPLRGKISLKGYPEAAQRSFIDGLAAVGIKWQVTKEEITNNNPNILNSFSLPETSFQSLSPLPEYALPLLTALAACSVLAGGEASLPQSLLSNGEAMDFLLTLGLTMNESGKLSPQAEKSEAHPWLAPDAQWALALSLAACANKTRRPILLANPGIMTTLWSGFWPLYNGLPDPKAKAAKKAAPEKKGRRILTNIIAVPPEE